MLIIISFIISGVANGLMDSIAHHDRFKYKKQTVKNEKTTNHINSAFIFLCEKRGNPTI